MPQNLTNWTKNTLKLIKYIKPHKFDFPTLKELN